MMLSLLASALLCGAANAQETIDVGVLKDSDVSVVQNLLYPKKDHTELGFHVGWMPFDAFTTTPVGAFSYTMHRSELFALEASLGGGYGLKSRQYRQLEGPAYGIAPDAYRYLGSLLVDAQYTPIYAKMSVLGGRIFHHDLYLLGGAGLTVEQSIIPDSAMAYSPTVGLGVGARVFLSKEAAIRIQLRDDLMMQYRSKTADTQPWFFKQNVAVTVGYVLLRK
jgi:outer membrane beta-barrel protein